MSTQIFKVKDADRKWYVIDATGLVLGRLSTIIADTLRGKGKATFSPNVDSGDNVIVLNAAKVILSKESKNEDKKYYRHSGYPGGIKKETFSEAMTKHPERVIQLAVKGMLQSNKLGTAQMKRLRVYKDAEHKHTQELLELNLNTEKKTTKETK